MVGVGHLYLGYTKDMKQLRGVNLGGWLVLERWITPGLFEGSEARDEYDLCCDYGEQAHQLLAMHRQNFITKRTIKQIKARGLDTVRLPIGYWLFDDVSPFVAGADDCVHQLFRWCNELGIGVILDIHAAPGSQNGWDHSGHAGQIGWGSTETVQATLNFLHEVIERYGHENALEAIEVLNEPHWDVSLGTLLEYYQKAYDLIRSMSPTLPIIMSDAFRPDDMARQLQRHRFTGVMMDVHLYQLFTDEDRALDFEGHLHKTRHLWANHLHDLQQRVPIIVGEWSAAMSELYQPIDQPAHVYNYAHVDYVKYFTAQRDVFDKAGVSWTYWTAKTQYGGPWSLLDNPDFIAITTA